CHDYFCLVHCPAVAQEQQFLPQFVRAAFSNFTNAHTEGSLFGGVFQMSFQMRFFWRSTVRRQRLQTIRTILIGLPFVAVSSNAFAQSITGGPINAATGQSLTDAVSQNEKELIDREVLGGAPAGRSSTGGAGMAGVTSFPTGRLRTSDHDALKPQTDQSFSF